MSKRAWGAGAMVVLTVIFAVAAATKGRWGGLAIWAVQATFWVVFLSSNWKRWKQGS